MSDTRTSVDEWKIPYLDRLGVTYAFDIKPDTDPWRVVCTVYASWRRVPIILFGDNYADIVRQASFVAEKDWLDQVIADGTAMTVEDALLKWQGAAREIDRLIDRGVEQKELEPWLNLQAACQVCFNAHPENEATKSHQIPSKFDGLGGVWLSSSQFGSWSIKAEDAVDKRSTIEIAKQVYDRAYSWNCDVEQQKKDVTILKLRLISLSEGNAFDYLSKQFVQLAIAVARVPKTFVRVERNKQYDSNGNEIKD